MKYWRASRAGNERAERAKLRAKAQLGSLGSLVNEPIFGIFLRAERARTLARLVRDFPLAAWPARLDANPASHCITQERLNVTWLRLGSGDCAAAKFNSIQFDTSIEYF